MVDRKGLKSVFRRKAHRLHPDRAAALGAHAPTLTRRFRELDGAYRLLLEALDRAGGRLFVPPHHPAEPRRRWIPEPLRYRSPEPTRPRPAPQHADPGPEVHLRPQGTVPRRRLRFAQYLYHSRIIDWTTLCDALRWQCRLRPRIGDIARRLRYLTHDDVCEILRHRGADERFGEAALRLRKLDARRLLVLLGNQQLLDRPIGGYFVERGILTRGELQELLRRHIVHNIVSVFPSRATG
jgi:AcrR family transcriptional regulator